MVNTTYPEPIIDWVGRTIRTEVPGTATTSVPDVANLTPEMGTYPLTGGGIPSPNPPEHPEAQAKYLPWLNFQPAKHKASRIANLTPVFRASHGWPSGRRGPVPTCTQIFRLYFNEKSRSGYRWVHLSSPPYEKTVLYR